jgi:hypothetical protein
MSALLVFTVKAVWLKALSWFVLGTPSVLKAVLCPYRVRKALHSRVKARVALISAALEANSKEIKMMERTTVLTRLTQNKIKRRKRRKPILHAMLVNFG